MAEFLVAFDRGQYDFQLWMVIDMPVLDHQSNNVQYYSGRIQKAKPWHVKHALKIWAIVYAAMIVWSQK